MAIVAGPGCTDTRKTAAPEQSASGNSAQASADGDTCPYLPSFVAVRKQVARMDASTALSALNAYRNNPTSENTDACQAMALDDDIGAREQALVTLRLADGRSIPAQASYRCDAIDPATTGCDGAIEDATAHPYSTGIFRDGAGPVTVSGPTTATIDSALAGAKLDAMYRLRVADLLDGGRATRLPSQPITLAPDPSLMAAIAIYTTASPPRTHKLVWYYGAGLNSPPASAAGPATRPGPRSPPG